MKTILFLIVTCSALLSAKEYCIILYSSKVFEPSKKVHFLKLFPNGVIEKYKGYYEFKLEGFQRYSDAKNTLKRVRQSYRDAFIINCNTQVVSTNFQLLESVSLASNSLLSKQKNNHKPLVSSSVYIKKSRPDLDEPEILKAYQIPKKSKRTPSELYDILSYKQYVHTILNTNERVAEAFYQKKIDYILSEIENDKYNFDVYAEGYLRTGTAISAQTGIVPNVQGDYSGAGVVFNASKLLYDGAFALRNSYDILYKRLADIKEINAKEKLVILATSLYSNLFVSQKELKVVKEIYKKQQKIYTNIKEGMKKGKISFTDFLDAKSDLLDVKRTISEVENSYLYNNFLLRYSIHSKSQKPFQLLPIDLNKIKLESLAKLQKKIIHNSSEMALESNYLKIKELDLLYQKRRFYPIVTFDSYLGYGWSTNKKFNLSNAGRGKFWELGLKVKVPIYNRGDIRLQEQKSRLEVLKQKSTLSRRQREILSLSEKSYHNLIKIRKQLDILEEQLKLFLRKIDIVEAKYLQGYAQYRDFAESIKHYLGYKREYIRLKELYNQEASILFILLGKRDFYEQ